MKEHSLWRYLQQTILPKQGHYTRIESECSSGFPDVHYSIDGASGTLELKSTKRPKAKYPFSGKDGLRKSQRIWIREESAAGGRVILALQVGKTVCFLRGELYADDLHIMDLSDITRVGVLVIKSIPTSKEILQRLYKELTES